MLVSSTRISLPAFEPEELEKLITALVAVDGEKWLPKSRPGTCLYLRPTMIGSAPALGVATPKEGRQRIFEAPYSSSENVIELRCSVKAVTIHEILLTLEIQLEIC